MIDTVKNITDEAEEITEELTHSIGVIITKATPLLAPLASGLTVLFAFYDGGGRMLDGKVAYPYAIAFAIGFLLMMAVEGVNFAAIHNRDRADAVKRRDPHLVWDIDASSIVNFCLWLTIAVVFALETLPGVVLWWYDEISVGDMAFRFGLLILPLFSRAGARIYSLSAILDALEGVQEKRRSRKREDAEFALELDIKRKEAEQRLELQRAEAEQKLELQREKVLSKSVQRSVQPDVQRLANTPVGRREPGENGQTAKGTMGDMLDIFRQEPDASQRDVARRLGRSPQTVNNWLKELETEGRVSVNGTVAVL